MPSWRRGARKGGSPVARTADLVRAGRVRRHRRRASAELPPGRSPRVDGAVGPTPRSGARPVRVCGDAGHGRPALRNRHPSWGGIDVQIAGIGVNGHVGFNEPGSSLASRTRVKTLSEQTRRDNSRFFDSLKDVPMHCITQGLGTILEGRHILLLAFGAAKARALAGALEGPVTSSRRPRSCSCTRTSRCSPMKRPPVSSRMRRNTAARGVRDSVAHGSTSSRAGRTTTGVDQRPLVGRRSIQTPCPDAKT